MTGRRLVTAAALAALAGCGPRNFTNENDALRARVLDLEDRVAALEDENAELRSELAVAAAAPGSLPEAVRASVPHVTAIAIGRLSHVRPPETDGTAPELVVYVVPRDGRGRFVQLVGTLSVNAALLPEDGPAQTIGLVTLAPADLRDAYRSGFTGTHYTVELPLTLPAGVAATAVDVRVAYVDGRTGHRHETSAAIALEE